MAYSRTTWTDNEAPYLNATNLNKIENGIYNNGSGIDTNSQEIEENAEDILDNAKAIAINTEDIASNKTEIDINADNILGLSVGEVYQGTWTPEAGTEYPASPEGGWSYYIQFLDDDGYEFVGGDLTGRIANNGDKIIYNGTAWSMIDNTNDMLGYYLVDDVSSMLSLSPLHGAFCHCYGYNTANDGGGGGFNYDSTLSGTNNGGTILDGWVRQYEGALDAKFFGATGDGTTDDTLAIQALCDFATQRTDILFSKGTYIISSKIDMSISYKNINAYEAIFVATHDGIMFDFNPDFDENNIEGTSKSYGYWFGGSFYGTNASIVNTVAMQVRGIRQMHISDCIFGNSGSPALGVGIQINGLGGHVIRGNRFIQVNTGVEVPALTATGSTSIPVTTTSFHDNNFTMASMQKAFYVNGGWNRWNINGGYINGSGAECVHFTNNEDGVSLSVTNVGFEQAVENGKYIYIQDTTGTPVSPVSIIGCSFTGDPAGGGHIAIDLEAVLSCEILGSRIQGAKATGNYGIQADENCTNLNISESNRIAVDGLNLLLPRTATTVMSPFQVVNRTLTNFNGDSYSTETIEIDMAVAMGASYPLLANPTGYNIMIACRDSGSEGTASRGVKLYAVSNDTVTKKLFIDLTDLPNDQRISNSVYVPANTTTGNIYVDLTASGTDTLDVWMYVQGIYN